MINEHCYDVNIVIQSQTFQNFSDFKLIFERSCDFSKAIYACFTNKASLS